MGRVAVSSALGSPIDDAASRALLLVMPALAFGWPLTMVGHASRARPPRGHALRVTLGQNWGGNGESKPKLNALLIPPFTNTVRSKKRCVTKSGPRPRGGSHEWLDGAREGQREAWL